MKSLISSAVFAFLLSSSATGLHLVKRDCAANNCIRQVRASNGNAMPPLATRKADCSAITGYTITVSLCPTTVRTTVRSTSDAATTVKVVTSTIQETSVSVTTIEATSTSISIATSTTRVEGYPRKERRQAACTPTTIVPAALTVPTYASGCVDPAQYASACSCNGIMASTSTLSQETVFSTSSRIAVRTPTSTSTSVTTSVTTVFSTTSSVTTQVSVTTTVATRYNGD